MNRPLSDLRLRVWLVILVVLSAFGAGCNAILGNDEHAVAVDAASSGSEAEPTDATMDVAPAQLPDASRDVAVDRTAGDSSIDATGVADAGIDAAPDSEPPSCTPGGACAPSDCELGTYACDAGTRVCEVTTDVDAGSPCASGSDGGAHVCNGGQCVACNAGGDCSDPSTPCLKKAYDCSSGTPQCKVTGNITDGTACGDAGLLYCTGGVCSACQVGAACTPSTNSCHVGKVTACTAGVPTCTDQNTSSSAGTACMSSAVCDGNGNCVSCSPNAQCNPGGNVCQLGVQACAAGYQCNNAANAQEGQTCGGAGSGEICHSGACVACNAASCANGCCDPTLGCVQPASQSTTRCGTGLAGGACRTCPNPSAGTGGATCGNNTCGITCTGTTSRLCSTTSCVDPTVDPNCGTCGHSCTATISGSTCGGAAGQCVCSGTLSVCGTLCANEATDSTNCGACGNTCGAGSSCVGRACTCNANLSSCPSGCVNEQTDNNNCGSCQLACSGFGPGFQCVQGSCTCGPTTPNGSACTRPGNTAGTCYGGTCVLPMGSLGCSVPADCVPGGCVGGFCLGTTGSSGFVSCGNAGLLCQAHTGCSFGFSGGSPTCGTALPTGGVELTCDDPSDCATGQDCCSTSDPGGVQQACVTRTSASVVGSGCMGSAAAESVANVVCDFSNPIATCPTNTSCKATGNAFDLGFECQ